jgi:hypothetical protein
MRRLILMKQSSSFLLQHLSISWTGDNPLGCLSPTSQPLGSGRQWRPRRQTLVTAVGSARRGFCAFDLNSNLLTGKTGGERGEESGWESGRPRKWLGFGLWERSEGRATGEMSEGGVGGGRRKMTGGGDTSHDGRGWLSCTDYRFFFWSVHCLSLVTGFLNALFTSPIFSSWKIWGYMVIWCLFNTFKSP